MGRRSVRTKLPRFQLSPLPLSSSKDSMTPRQPYVFSHREHLPASPPLSRAAYSKHTAVAFCSSKFLHPSPKRSLRLFPILPSVLPVVRPAALWRSVTPQPPRGKVERSHRDDHSHNEVTTQCGDPDFPYSPRACEYDTGNLFAIKMRKLGRILKV